MKMIFDLDMEKCVGCGACAVACMDQNDIFPEDGDLPFRTVEIREEEGLSFSVACLHCESAPCIAACPKGCIRKDEQGLCVYDSSMCIGCRRCAAVCPYSAPKFGPDGKMRKCDGCAQRLKYGLEPACKRICTSSAIICACVDEYPALKPEMSLRERK